MNRATYDAHESAREKALKCFSPSIGPSQRTVTDGFIDVLGASNVALSHTGLQVVEKKNFPRIYERLWRPVVSRMFFGLFGMGARREREATLEMLEVSRGDRILDVGCGPGNYTEYLAEASGDGLVVGVDASGAMLAAGARKRGGSNIAFVRADASALPFADGGFDVVCCVGAVHMVETPKVAFAEMIRMLAPGGRLGVTTTCGRKDAPTRVRNGITFFAREELPEALTAAGLVDIGQRVVHRAQFISARRPAEDPVGR